MLKAEAAKAGLLAENLPRLAKSQERKQSTYRSAEGLLHPKAAATRVRFRSVCRIGSKEVIPSGAARVVASDFARRTRYHPGTGAGCEQTVQVVPRGNSVQL